MADASENASLQPLQELPESEDEHGLTIVIRNEAESGYLENTVPKCTGIYSDRTEGEERRSKTPESKTLDLDTYKSAEDEEKNAKLQIPRFLT